MEVLRAAQDKIAPFVEETLENLNNLSFEAVNDKLSEFDLPSVDILGIQIGIATIVTLTALFGLIAFKLARPASCFVCSCLQAIFQQEAHRDLCSCSTRS
jgi:hypothetical protein